VFNIYSYKGDANQNNIEILFSPVREDIIKETTDAGENAKCVFVVRGDLIHCCWEYKLVLSLRKSVWRFLQKLKLEPPYDPAIPVLGIYLMQVSIQ
jgi:hypothetical protein